MERTSTGPGSKRHRSEGFSLIEVMVAMVILGIGLLGVGQMIPMALVGVTQAGLRTRAVQAAQERLDDLRSNDFDDPALQAGTYSETQGNYTLDWVITDDVPVTGTKRIEISTSWESITGTRNATLHTFITES